MNPSMSRPPEALHHPHCRATASLIIQAAMLVATWVGPCGPAAGWVLTISAGPKAAFLQVGIGSYSGVYNSGGTPLNNTQVNVVSVTVPASAVGRGTAQAMTSNSTQSVSFYDNFAVCNPPSQVYIGGWVRTPTGTGTGVLSVASPANLTSGVNTIPFSQISWTSTANGNAAANIPAGTFNGGTLALANFARNTFVENCFTYRYANTIVAAAGTFTGRATFTLTTP